MQIPWDEVQIPLIAESDIVSDSVRVVVRAILSLAGEDAARVRAILGDALGGVLDGPWQFSSVERDEDRSGMERVVSIATVRVKEHQTGGLVERLKKASRPGLQLTLQSVVTRPPRAEIEKIRIELRRKLYELAQKEAAVLNEVYGGSDAEQGWRVGMLVIAETLNLPSLAGTAARQAQLAYPSYGIHSPGVVGESLSAEAEDNSPNVEVATRLTLRATLKLKRVSVPPPKGGYFASVSGE